MNEYSWFNLPSRVWALEQGGGSSELPIGTDRQVLGYNAGNAEAITLGWKQFSDLPTPPPFSNGVLTGTAFQNDGSALFGFIELALGEAGTALIKPNAIPFYNPGQIGTGGGTLQVADGIDVKDAVSLGQLNAAIATLTARIEALENA